MARPVSSRSRGTARTEAISGTASGDPQLNQEIGTAAGEVYRYLHENGAVTMNKLRRDLPLGRGRLDQAIGWLAREEKLAFVKEKRTTYVSLHDTPRAR